MKSIVTLRTDTGARAEPGRRAAAVGGQGDPAVCAALAHMPVVTPLGRGCGGEGPGPQHGLWRHDECTQYAEQVGGHTPPVAGKTASPEVAEHDETLPVAAAPRAGGRARVFRVFVSSTFDDFEVERDVLRRDVWPRLRELFASTGPASRRSTCAGG